MARKKEAEKLLRDGLIPSEIAADMGISEKSVIQYLQTRVGEGHLRFSDIYFTFPPDKRAELQDLISRYGTTGQAPPEVAERGFNWEEVKFFASLRTNRVFAGDLYEYISDIELRVHANVRTTLEKEFGVEESGWWRKGIAERIRAACAENREKDEDPCEDAFAYTYLIDLAKIICDNWRLFCNMFPNHYAQNRQSLKSDFARLNRIRNSVMHPVKQRKWTVEDFQFVLNLRAQWFNSEA